MPLRRQKLGTSGGGTCEPSPLAAAASPREHRCAGEVTHTALASGLRRGPRWLLPSRGVTCDVATATCNGNTCNPAASDAAAATRYPDAPGLQGSGDTGPADVPSFPVPGDNANSGNAGNSKEPGTHKRRQRRTQQWYLWQRLGRMPRAGSPRQPVRETKTCAVAPPTGKQQKVITNLVPCNFSWAHWTAFDFSCSSLFHCDS